MASFNNQFVQPAGMKKWGMGLTAVGVLALLGGLFFLAFSDDEHNKTRFWAVLLHNSVYFLLIVNAAMFFLCATTLAWAGFTQSFRRVVEAISVLVIPVGILAFIVLMCLVFGHQHHIYHWVDEDAVAVDPILLGKSGFLNPTFFTIWTVITIGGWMLLGRNMRKISREADDQPMEMCIRDRLYPLTLLPRLFPAGIRPYFHLISLQGPYSPGLPWCNPS